MVFMSRQTVLAVLATALAAAPAAPDEIFLRGGGRVTGVIVERTNDAVVVETAPGRVTLSMRRIEKIVESRSALEAFRDRATALAPGDVDGWAALARWAAERDLLTQARDAWQRVLAADPSHPEANAALGRVELDGAWMGQDEAFRARGYVDFEGRWVTPAEHEALVREAEARAREAEARAREAEAGALEPAEGIPYWWGWGGVGVVPPFVEPTPPPPSESLPPPPPPRPTPPSSIGPTHPSDRPAAGKPVPRP